MELRFGGDYWENKVNIILNELEIELDELEDEKSVGDKNAK